MLFLAVGSVPIAYASGSPGKTSTAIGAYAGYQVTGNYTELRVKGSWVVPTVDCAITPNSMSNISVIIDGIDGEGDAMEAGTYQNCVAGVAYYGAFVNIYPTLKPTSQPTLLKVHAGDVIEAQGTWRCNKTGCLKGGECLCWHSNIIDETTGMYSNNNGYTSLTYQPALDSAALILSSDGHTLSSMGTIYSGIAYTGVHRSDVAGPWKGTSTFGETAALSGYGLVLLTMAGTSVSPLSSDGSSFSISFSS
jgi:Peptidase A4 family